MVQLTLHAAWPTLDGMRRPGSLVAAGVALAILAGRITLPAGAAAHPGSKPPDVVCFRSVLCFAPSYKPTIPAPGLLTSSSCSAASRLNDSNLGVTPDANSASGFSSQNVAPDAALAGVRSTSAAKETAAATVLLPGFSQASLRGVTRYVLGPAEMTSASVAEASASKNQTGAWVVDYTMTKRGSALWDKVAEENFHKLLGIDFNGTLVSAPIIQPTQSAFSTFAGHGEISGNLTKAEAVALAHALHHG
jgi:hypothetical protein